MHPVNHVQTCMTVHSIDDLQKESCEGTLKLQECLEAFKLMDNNKSPGLDGLPAEFYKVLGRIYIHI